MFATPAYAQAAGGGAAAFGSFVPLILIFAIMYFLLIRPQQKKMKERAIARVQNGLLAQGVKVRAVISTLSQVLSKTEPASE